MPSATLAENSTSANFKQLRNSSFAQYCWRGIRLLSATMSIKIPIRLALLLAVLSAAASVHAIATVAGDDAPSSTPTSELSLEQLSQRAGIIFAGKVVEIDQPAETTQDPTPAISRFVRITFRVDDGIRNANSGDLITIREWAGLWQSGSGRRYRVGEKLLMFYYPPNTSCTTSPVAGASGRFAITAEGQIHITPEGKQPLFRSARLRGFELDANLNAPATRQGVPYNTVARALRLIAADSQ